MTRRLWALLAFLAAPCYTQYIRMNHVQVLHSHNAYHTCPLPNMVALFNSPIGQTVIKGLGDSEITPDALAYGHAPLIEQVRDLGVRSIEIDIVYDPDGGRFAYRAGPKLARTLGVSNNSGQAGGPGLRTPGWKVLHIPDLDFQSSCDGLTSCLAPIAAWSQANPTHSPLHIAIELKTWDPSRFISPMQLSAVTALLSIMPDPPKNLAATPTPDTSHLTALESEILSVFNRTQIFTPDQFRANYTSLQERIAQAGWPRLASLRGKVIFRAMGSGAYLGLLSSLRPGGRNGLLFTEAVADFVSFTPDNDTVFVFTSWSSLVPSVNTSALTAANITWGPTLPDLTPSQKRVVVDLYRQGINQLVSGGKVMVRAVADMATQEARTNFHGWANAAAAGGAHFINTDYPGGSVSQCSFTSPYTVPLQQVKRGSWNRTAMSSINTTYWRNRNNTAKLASVCNPVAAQRTCVTWALERQPAKHCICYSLI